MMVEAGGTEKSWHYYDDGAPKVTEEVLAEGLEAAKTWIRESINLQRQLVADVVAARGPIETIEFSTFSRLRRRRVGPGRGGRHRPHRQGQPGHRQGRAQRRPGRGRRRRSRPPWPTSSPSASRRDQGGHPLADQEAGAQAHRRGGRPHRRPWHGRHPPAVGRDRPASRRPTARRSSSGARPRCST